MHNDSYIKYIQHDYLFEYVCSAGGALEEWGSMVAIGPYWKYVLSRSLFHTTKTTTTGTKNKNVPNFGSTVDEPISGLVVDVSLLECRIPRSTQMSITLYLRETVTISKILVISTMYEKVRLVYASPLVLPIISLSIFISI